MFTDLKKGPLSQGYYLFRMGQPVVRFRSPTEKILSLGTSVFRQLLRIRMGVAMLSAVLALGCTESVPETAGSHETSGILTLHAKTIELTDLNGPLLIEGNCDPTLTQISMKTDQSDWSPQEFTESVPCEGGRFTYTIADPKETFGFDPLLSVRQEKLFSIKGRGLYQESTVVIGKVIYDNSSSLPLAELSGEPANPSNETVLNITVGGPNVTHYAYKVGVSGTLDCTDDTDYSSAIAASTLITDDISGVSDATLEICVIGSDGSQWQEYSAATAYTWRKDTQAPTAPSIDINTGDAYTADDQLTLALSVTDTNPGTMMYVTESAGCATGGTLEPYVPGKTWNLSNTNNMNIPVYVQFTDAAGNPTACISDTITHDDVDPTAPTGLTLGGTEATNTESPTIAWATDASDATSGVDEHQVRIIDTVTSNEIFNWTAHTSGQKVTGLALVDQRTYRVELRAVDKAGNSSDTVTAVWTASYSALATISGEPNGTNNVTVLDVTVGGGNIISYMYKVGETASVDCSAAGSYSGPIPIATKITDDISALGDESITLCVVGYNGVLWQDHSVASTATWTKDTQAPASPSIMIAGGDTYTTTDNVALTLSATDAVQMVISNNSDCSAGTGWIAYNTAHASWTLGQTNATATVYAKFSDAVGNESACVSDTIVHDDLAPDAPSAPLISNAYSSVDETPNLSWTSPSDNGPSGVASYEVAVYSAGGDGAVGGGDDVEVVSFQAHTSGNSIAGLTLVDTTKYYFVARAIDNAGNTGLESTASPLWHAAASVTATLSGQPSNPSNDTVLDITVGGTGVSTYMYKVGETDSIDCSVAGGYSTSIPVGTKITNDISGLGEESITICVVGSNGASWQDFSSATTYSWVKDTQAPTAPSISIAGGVAYINTVDVALTLSAGDTPHQMVISNNNDCSAGSGWIAYNTSHSNWTLGQTNTTATVYVKFRDEALNESACISDTIVHDDQDPDAPPLPVFAAVPQSLTQTPDLSWTAPADNGPSGIASYEIQIHLTSDNSIVTAWQAHTSGNPATGLMLTDGTQYYYKVRALDKAGNISAESVASNNWTAMSALEATLAGVPTDPSLDTVLDITVGGTNVAVYKYKIGEALSTDCSVGTGYGAEVSLPVKITDDISTLNDGDITLCVIGGNGGGEWQAEAAATTYTWEKDTQAPGFPSIMIAGDDTYTKTDIVGLTLSANGFPAEMYITNTAGCTGDGGWESYSTSKPSWSLGQLNTTATVNVKFRDNVGNETACVSDTIIHDSIAPAAPAIQAHDSEYDSLNESPSLNWTGVSDSGSGIAKYEVQIHAAADNSVILSWQQSLNSSSVMGLSLTEGADYYYVVRAVDGAGNEGTVSANSDAWTAYSPAQPMIVSGEPQEYDSNTTFNIEIGGHNVGHYKYKVGSGVICTDSLDYAFESPIANPINLDLDSLSIADGPVTLCVLGSRDGTTWPDPLLSLSHSWTKDTVAPQVDSVNIPTLTKSHFWATIGASDDNDAAGLEMNNSDIGCQGGTWIPYNPNSFFYMFQDNSEGPRTFYVSVRDMAGNVSSCATETFELDQTAPFATFTLVSPLNTSDLPIEWDVVLSETPMSQLNANMFGQLAGPSVTWELKFLGGLNYRLKAIRVDGEGPVQPKINGIVFQDLAGNYNVASQGNAANYSFGEQRFIKISAGAEHACGLTTRGKPYCWGRGDTAGNGVSRLGVGGSGPFPSVSEPTPVDVDHYILPPNSKSFIDISAGVNHSCGIASDGIAYCWGDGGDGQLGHDFSHPYDSFNEPVPVNTDLITGGSTKFIKISVGHYHTCALSQEGIIYCWGYGVEGQRGDGDLETVIPRPTLPVYTDHFDPGRSTRFIDVSASAQHTCAIAGDGLAYCWGQPFAGRIGDQELDTEVRRTPSAVYMAPYPGVRFTQITTGSEHSCALSDQGDAYCWGYNQYYRLGCSSCPTQSKYPQLVSTQNLSGQVTKFVRIDAGVAHTCAITTDGKPACWGKGAEGQLGYGSTTNRQWPGEVSATKEYSTISASNQFTCGLEDGGIPVCWGFESFDGRLGRGTLGAQANVPQYVRTSHLPKLSKHLLSVSVGWEHTCGISNQNEAYCWGMGGQGRLGHGTTDGKNRPYPVDTTSVESFQEIVTGLYHSCGLNRRGEIYCWGMNSAGELGNGGSGQEESPVKIDTTDGAAFPTLDSKVFKQVVSGATHSCGLSGTGQAYCWGSSAYGQVGNDVGAGNFFTPQAVRMDGISSFVQLTAGFEHTCGLTADGKGYCWGNHLSGRLGATGYSPPQDSPIEIDMSAIEINGHSIFITKIEAGYQHTCISNDEGKTFCWGHSNFGQTGANTNNAPIPTIPLEESLSIPFAGFFKSLTLGDNQTCGIADAGLLYCWGYSIYGETGQGVTNDTAWNPSEIVPPNPPDIDIWYTQTSTRLNHTCGVTAGGNAYCWGDALNGKLGTVSTFTTGTPTPVDITGL